MSTHPGSNPGANLKSISHRCHPILVAFVWELTKETTHLPLGCLQSGPAYPGQCRAGLLQLTRPICTAEFLRLGEKGMRQKITHLRSR